MKKEQSQSKTVSLIIKNITFTSEKKLDKSWEISLNYKIKWHSYEK